MVHNNTWRLTELTAGVCKQGDNRALLDTQILCPSFHDSTIIHAENKHISHSLLLENISFCQVPRYLLRRSGGCKSAWQSHNDDLLARTYTLHIHLGRREAEVHLDTWNAIPHLDRFGLFLPTAFIAFMGFGAFIAFMGAFMTFMTFMTAF